MFPPSFTFRATGLHGTSATHPALKWALALWLAFGVAVGVRTLLRPDSHTVFPVLVAGAEHWWDDQPLYARYRPLDYFRYPPLFAIAVTPLAALGPRAGGVLWAWLNLAVYAWGLWRLRRDVLPGEWTPPREAVYFALGLAGALRGLWNGQSNALAIGLLLLGAAAVARRRWWSGAAFLAAPVLIKLTPLAIVLLLCALWPRKLSRRVALVLAAGLLLPFATRSPSSVLDQYRGWFDHLLTSSGERWPGFRDVWTVWLAAQHVAFGRSLVLDAPMDHPLLYRVAQVCTGLGVLGFGLWQQRRGVERRTLVLLTVALGLAWLMLFGPAIEHATYAFLAPVLAWAAVQRSGWRPARPVLAASLVLVHILGWGALPRAWPAAEPYLLAALPAGTALFAVWLCGYAATLAPRTENGAIAAAPPSAPATRAA